MTRKKQISARGSNPCEAHGQLHIYRVVGEMDENDIPPAFRGTFRQIREDFTLNLESDAHDLAVERGMIREHVGEMPIADPGAKKEIMRELLHDPKYLSKALDALLRSCESKGLNPVDCQVFMDVLCTLIADGKIQFLF